MVIKSSVFKRTVDFVHVMQPTVYILTYLLTYSLTHSLTPWSRVLLEKLTGFQLVKKFPAFYGTRRFITAFTRALHLFIF